MRETIDRALQERSLLAQTAASHLEYIIRENLARLQNIAFHRGVDLEDKDLGPEREALHNAYLHSIFTEGVFLLDRQGNLLWIEPYRPERIRANLFDIPPVRNALEGGKPIVSNLVPIRPLDKNGIYALVPIRNWRGKIVGLAGGEIDPLNPGFRQILQPIKLGETGYIDIVDGQGMVLASTRPQHVLKVSDHGNSLANLIRAKTTSVGTCHSCHGGAEVRGRETEVMAFAPLSSVSWGVSVRQSEREALAPARSMERRFFTYGLFLLLIALVLAWGTAQSVVRPISILTEAAQRIAGGNLSDPVPPLGEDEIGRLGQSFDTMRVKLKSSLERIEEWNRELERRVQERTKELEESREELKKKEEMRGELLRKVITAQEEERKRIARELHDETSQALAALVLGLDTATASALGETRERMGNLKALAEGILDGIHQLIYDLRPSVLDDLGLPSAIRWYAESRLGPQGIHVHFETSGTERRLPTQVETAVFRATQEALTNIVKHAEAENTAISLEYRDSSILIEIEDDGKGFHVDPVSQLPEESRGLGLPGMKERITLLQGTLSIESEPDGGTRIAIEVPLPPEGIKDA